MSILIVDPQVESVARVQSFFTEYGFQCPQVVKTAADARVYIDEHQDAVGNDAISLIVVNAGLDEGDGFTFCQQVRKSPIGEYVYLIVLISSVNNSVAIETVKHCGANDYAVKPYEGKAFFTHLIKYANQRAVLLIEDDPALQVMISGLLHKQHIELMICDDGLKAYNLINKIAPPRLVLMDIGLPNKSGVQLVKHIRDKSIWRKTPIIMLTASTSADDVKGSLSAGASEYIVKPFQPADFVDRISKYLGMVG